MQKSNVDNYFEKLKISKTTRYFHENNINMQAYKDLIFLSEDRKVIVPDYILI